MASFTTKFNLRDTAYLADLNILNIVPVVVTDIYLHDLISTTGTPAVPSYKVRFVDSSISGKTLYPETDLYTLEEAKTELRIALTNRSADIESAV